MAVQIPRENQIAMLATVHMQASVNACKRLITTLYFSPWKRCAKPRLGNFAIVLVTAHSEMQEQPCLTKKARSPIARAE